jgi:ribonucleoside-diphosphate reductase alpha chain
MICLFDIDDEAMLAYKKGAWWEARPERARVNVSVVAFRKDVLEPIREGNPFKRRVARATTAEQFKKFWEAAEASKSGEPGIIWSNDPDCGYNPCCEISLKHKQLCNLSTVNFSTVKSQADLDGRVALAAVLGTLQAGFVDMHYLGEEWEKNCREEALLGVSLTGIGDNPDYKEFDFAQAADAAKAANAEIAEAIGINRAARITCVKPEGSSSLVLGTASGVHGRHAPYYIRRFRFNANEAIIQYLARVVPDLVVQDKSDPNGLILELPQKSPEGSINRMETAIETLERLKFFRENWIEPGHVSGENTHNVSTTVSVRDNEWGIVGKWLWDSRAYYNGIAVLPYSDHSYVQAPFEDCTYETYNELMKKVKNIDLTKVVEEDDTTDQVGELACQGGACNL